MGYLAAARIVEVGQLKKTYADLVSKTGELPPSNPNEIAMLRIETDEPLYFAWRIRFPPNQKLRLVKTNGMGSSSSSSISEGETFYRLRMRIVGNMIDVFTVSDTSQSVMNFQTDDPELLHQLQTSPERVIQTITDEKPHQILAADEPVEILRIALPKDSKKSSVNERMTEAGLDRSNDKVFRVIIEPQP